MGKEDALRALPKVDVLLLLVQEALEGAHKARGMKSGVLSGNAVASSHAVLLAATREVIDLLRSQVLAGALQEIPGREALVAKVLAEAKRRSSYMLRPVINATGVVLHTNLGRAVLGEEVAEHVKQVAMHYSTLEYDVHSGARGSRQAVVEDVLCALTGCEAAMVVNNNAAAVLLALSALCRGKQVVVSRGELVEIGGSFRVPDVMEQSGAVLREVGTTNKTRIEDYIDAYEQELTGAFLKVHTSNFKVVGFTQEVPLSALVSLGASREIPVLYDLGSGALLPREVEGFEEPTVRGAIRAGAHVVAFSGDKLLGGPQAGILLGNKAYISAMKKHPLARALRVDKLTLAALEATLRLYQDEERAASAIPTLAAIMAKPEALYERAQALQKAMSALPAGFEARVEEMQGQVGGGSVPGQTLPSWGVAVYPKGISLQGLDARLRAWETPIVGRIAKDRYLLDVRTVADPAFETVAAAFRAVFEEGEA